MKNINIIISEEVKSILNESQSFEPEALRFTSHVLNPLFYNFDEFSDQYDEEVVNANIVVDWQIGFWIQEDGIKTTSVNIIGVSGIYEIELYDKQSDALIQRISKDISEINWNFNIENFVVSTEQSTYIKSVTFDMKSRICLVEFFAVQ